MKAIMISIKPKWVTKILNGEKTIEIRKTMPKCDLPIDLYIYCTKEDSLIKLNENCKDKYICEQEFRCDDFLKMYSGYEGKGKVVAKFTLNKVDEYINGVNCEKLEQGNHLDFEKDKICELACINEDELYAYAEDLHFYSWHIDNLIIFDKPKELNEFYPYCSNEKCEYRQYNCKICHRSPLTKAPKSWQFIEVEE